MGLGAGDQRQALFTPSGLEDRGERHMNLFEVFADASAGDGAAVGAGAGIVIRIP